MFDEFWFAGDTTGQREEFQPQTEHEQNMLTTLASYGKSFLQEFVF
jgi:hypothetical protein